jgi:hypothetical protein
MKMKYVICICLSVFLSNTLLKAQVKEEKTIKLESIVEEVILTKCHLTELSYQERIQIADNAIKIGINFDNESLKTFWSPEVAVEYIFDAALYNIINTIWNAESSPYKKYQKIVFNIDIRPHDIPPVLLFEIQLKDWEVYKKGGEKVTLYRKIKITANGKTFPFDAQKAVDIE